MSVSTATDPVQTLVDILEATDAGDWPNPTDGKPDIIERNEETDFSRKCRKSRPDAAYVWSPAEGAISKFAAGVSTFEDVETVQVDLWGSAEHSDPVAEANNLAGDVISHVASEYWRDPSHEKTPWHEIEPTAPIDNTAQMRARGADQAVVSVQFVLERLQDL